MVSEIKERPILMSSPMVRAILAGTKTQTRRALRIQPHDDAEVVCDDFYPTVIDKRGEEQPGVEVFGAWWFDGEEALRCPYGRPGDRLWVRETWREWSDCAWHYAADGLVLPKQRDRDLAAFLSRRAPFTWESYTWRPSIHMPRAASRITLEITDMRVERLQEISEADAKAEGVNMPDGTPTPPEWWSYRQEYVHLWDRINGAGSWDANPWVWVICFRRLVS